MRAVMRKTRQAKVHADIWGSSVSQCPNGDSEQTTGEILEGPVLSVTPLTSLAFERYDASLFCCKCLLDTGERFVGNVLNKQKQN